MKLATLALAATVLVALGSAVALATMGGSQQAAARIVYFTHPDDAMSQVALLPEEALRLSDGRTVSSLSGVEQAEPAAIIVDASTVNDLPPDWLTERYNAGTVLVALNFSADQLTGRVLFGFPEGFGTLTDNGHGPGEPLEGIPYASIFFRTPVGFYEGDGIRAGQRHVDLDPARPELLLQDIERKIQDAAGIVPTAAPSQ